MAETSIEWATKVWNPTTGCDKVSPGWGLPRFVGDDTGGCYALAMARRLKAMGSAKYQHDGDPRTSGPGFGLTTHADALRLPHTWGSPERVFVNSMSDLSVGVDGPSATPWVALPLVKMATVNRRGARQMSGMWLPVSPSPAMGDLEQAKFTHPLCEVGPRVIGGIGGQPVLVVARVGGVVVGLVAVGDGALEELPQPLGLADGARVLGVADRPLVAVPAADAGVPGVPVERDHVAWPGLGRLAGQAGDLPPQVFGIHGRVAGLPGGEGGAEVSVVGAGHQLQRAAGGSQRLQVGGELHALGAGAAVGMEAGLAGQQVALRVGRHRACAQELAGGSQEAGIVYQGEAEGGALAAHHRQPVPEDAAACFTVAEVGAVTIAQGMVQFLAEGGGLTFAQVAGQDDEPEGLVVVNLLVSEHRGPPCLSGRADGPPRPRARARQVRCAWGVGVSRGPVRADEHRHKDRMDSR